jgi:UDP-glucose 4-epimerase
VATERLLDEGHEVVVFDNLERGHRRAVDRRAGFRAGDLRDRDRIVRVMKDVRPDAVMHFAAYALVGESMARPEMYFANNVVGGSHLAEAMLGAGVEKIVFSSTCATYGLPERVPIPETAPQRPTNPYGESKLMLERILDWYARRRGMKTVFLRYFNACGATAKFGEDHDPETHLIPLILQVTLGQRDKARIFGTDYDTPDGTCIRDYIHIVDLAEAHILALRPDVAGVFNVGTGRGYSVREVVEMAREVTGRRIPEAAAPRRPGDPPCLVASNARARKVLGWRPRYSDLRTIVQSALNWHRAHPRGYGK